MLLAFCRSLVPKFKIRWYWGLQNLCNSEKFGIISTHGIKFWLVWFKFEYAHLLVWLKSGGGGGVGHDHVQVVFAESAIIFPIDFVWDSCCCTR